MAKTSALFPEYVRLADGLRTGAIPSTPENEAAHEREFTKMRAHRTSPPDVPTLSQNGWATVPVAAACWALDAQCVERHG